MPTPIIVFAKAPVPGLVKTRLAVRIGDIAAARLHAALVERTLATARDAALGRVELCCAPDVDAPFFRDCEQRFGVGLTAQGEGDLGARMHRALARVLARDGCALLIGTDCPAMDAHYLAAAADALREGARVVLGPAEDGGYVLVGAREAVVPEMFVNMRWGQSTVLGVTRDRLRAAGVAWRELATSWDVDRPEDFDRLLAARLLPDGALNR